MLRASLATSTATLFPGHLTNKSKGKIMTATTPITNPEPLTEPYEIDESKVDQMFEAAARGDTQTVLLLATGLQLGGYTYDIERLTELAAWYGPLETNGDALISLLQTHEEGAVEANEDMKRYLNEARAQMSASGKPIPNDVLEVFNKVMNGEKINEEQAKKLYSWCLEAKELVIPSDYRSAIIGEQLQRLRDQYDQKVDSGTKRLSSFSVR
jgi:hypothetical protein